MTELSKLIAVGIIWYLTMFAADVADRDPAPAPVTERVR